MPETAPWTIGRLLSWTAEYFKTQGVESPRLDAEVLLAEARGCARIDLYAAFGEEASDAIRTKFKALVKQRAAGTPVAYLVGKREFYSMAFAVTRDVLIPRPETETLVVAALDVAKKLRANTPGLGTINVADVGTGSGAIAIAIARHIENGHVTALDISEAALQIARQNAETHSVTTTIDFIQSDLFASLPSEKMFEIIVSNPPYVSQQEFENLEQTVRDYEPKTALVAGATGMEVIERLIEEAKNRLKPGGWLLIEYSPMIAEKVREQLASDNAWTDIAQHKDLAGHQRVIEAKFL